MIRPAIKIAKGTDHVALIDAGDEFFAAPAISQLLMGESTIDVFNTMGYELAVFGNHEFDKGDMFNLMPYENSLVVFEMTGVQLKEILERSYRNYWYYEYEEDYGGYSHYTTCALATNAGNVIEYLDSGALVQPDGDDVLGLTIGGVPVDFTDDTTTYNVSTVNYVAAGSCNFNNDGETIWPLDQIIYDTQLYVRDAVIDYVEAQSGPIAPAVEGRLVFTTP